MTAVNLRDALIERSKAVVARQVKIGDKEVEAHFRRITAGERHELMKGQKLTRSGKDVSYEIDLGLNEAQQQKYVLFSVVNPDGTAFFADLDAVRRVDSALFKALYAEAITLDEDEKDDAKKD